MQRRMLKSKIHGATVTDSNVNYEGSISLDLDLMDAADLTPHEEVHVWDLTNGTRLSTYVIPAGRGSRTVAINGAAALLVAGGDRVIVGSFASYDESELDDFAARKVFVDEANRITRIVMAGAGEDRRPVREPAGAELC